MAFAPKFIIAGIALGGTGVGFGIENLTSSRSNNKGRSAKTKSVAVNNRCRLHKLIAIGSGKFELTTKEEIIEQAKSKGEEVNSESIERACLENAGKDIFISNKSKKWDYHQSDQSSGEHQNKFKQYLEALNSR
ncbi:hypothetical protein MHC_03740 [Mycoplasma haemocanis str. Illinois]|uniref:Uncharacterized protein n=1 Tax=Mycoplasma haemocanis (strain Illinois) TaxID=1111676 RepID=H6N7I6_MYCHN|nr:hypothetical protein [Mycoplasma haemocanis]AEW45608.1 hypothetical protein MHC_03740 [Mycoplasma haemocanis str. Illinois]